MRDNGSADGVRRMDRLASPKTMSAYFLPSLVVLSAKLTRVVAFG